MIKWLGFRKGDDFYASLAAKAKAAGGPSDNLSDVSDADPKELLRDIVRNLEKHLNLA